MGFYKKKNFEKATFGQHRLTCCYFDPYVGSDFNYVLCDFTSCLRLIVVVNFKTSSIPKGLKSGEQVGQGTGPYLTICHF